MKRLLPLTAALMLCPAMALAESPVEAAMARFVGTLSVTSNPYFADGTLQGCTLVFTALHQDWTYRQGALLRVDGNIGVMALDSRQVASNLKVVVNELQFKTSAPQFIPSAPSRAYLVGPDLKTSLPSLIQAAPSDTPGAYFGVFQLSPTFEMLMEAIETNEITIAFNNLKGGSDIRLKLELDVVEINDSGKRIRSPKMKNEYLECLKALVDVTLGSTEGAKGDLKQ